MKLLEYEAKAVLKKYNIPVPKGTITSINLSPPIVLKSQVPTGGRGKAGGIQIAYTDTELRDATRELLSLPIKGFIPKHLLYEELLDIERELYLSIIINRSSGTIELIAHPDGGVEIESHNQTEFFKKTLEGNGFDSIGESLAELYNLPTQSFALAEITEKLYRCFTESDATLLEINPLVLTKAGQLIAGDCKMTLDDAAAFRHPEWDFEDKPANTSFVELDADGTVATIANGAGLAMATVDAVTAKGLVPANFLDIGGGATTEKVVASFQQIMTYQNISAIVINIFGGIVRCDLVAQAIIEAREQIPHLPALYIRLSGNHSEEAAELLEKNGLQLYDTLDACLEEVRA